MKRIVPKIKLALLILVVLLFAWLGGTCLDRAFHDGQLPDRMVAAAVEITAGGALSVLAIVCAAEFGALYRKWMSE